MCTSLTNKLHIFLELPKPKPTHGRSNNHKANGLIRDLNIYVHGIPCITTFTILQNNVVDFRYSMLLGKPWLKDAKVAHDWGINTITIQGNGIVKTIIITKHLGGEVKRPKMLLCYDY